MRSTPAHVKAAAARTSTSGSINWNKVGDQLKTFFFGHSKTTHTVAKTTGTSHSLTR